MQSHLKLRVLTIVGSMGEHSCTAALAEAVSIALEARGVEVDRWNLRAKPLPFVDPLFHGSPERHARPEVREFVDKVSGADAIVIASPDYHNSYSGVVKNALDHLNFDQIRDKPVGLLSHGGGRSPQPVDHLRIVVRALYGLAIPTQVCTAKEDYTVGSDGGWRLRSADIEIRIERFVEELFKYGVLCGEVRRSACTITIIGGTGMLSHLCVEFAEQGHLVTVMARNEKRLEELRLSSIGLKGSIWPAAVDYRNTCLLTKALALAVVERGPINLLISWIRSDASGSHLAVLTFLAGMQSQTRYVEIRGSVSKSRVVGKREQELLRDDTLYSIVILGCKRGAQGTRWLTHTEICDGVREAIELGCRNCHVGEVAPC